MSLLLLVVDDDEMVRLAMEAVLIVLGYSVTLASSGEEALFKLSSGTLPDVIILDIRMPGIGGTEAFRHIRKLYPAIPVIIATGYADDEIQDMIHIHPFVSILEKPFTRVDLEQHLLKVTKNTKRVN